MNEKESFKIQPTSYPSDSDKSQMKVPYEDVVSQIAAKIKNEPFLFIIAIVALMIGLVVLAANLGSPDIRFVIVIVTLLAFVVILGYYIQMGLQEKWKHEERLQKVASGRTMAGGTIDSQKPIADAKYVIDAAGSTGNAIGDEAKVEQHFGDAGRSVTIRTPSAEAYTFQEQRTALELQLSRHQHNLTRLRTKKSVYAAGEEPLSLLNQIEAEEHEIQSIRVELEELLRE